MKSKQVNGKSHYANRKIRDFLPASEMAKNTDADLREKGNGWWMDSPKFKLSIRDTSGKPG